MDVQVDLIALIDSKLSPLETIDSKLEKLADKLETILQQTIKTNGRVTELERNKEEYKPLFFKVKDQVDTILQQDNLCRVNVHKEFKTQDARILELEKQLKEKVEERNTLIKEQNVIIETQKAYIEKLDKRTWLLAKIDQYPKAALVIGLIIFITLLGSVTGLSINEMIRLAKK